MFTDTGLWPLILIVACGICLFPLVIYECTGYAILSVAVLLAVLQVLGHFPIISYVQDHPGIIARYLCLYVIIGVLYSFLRWYVVGSKWRTSYLAAQTSSDAKREIWRTQPDASKAKSRITSWMMFWPWSGFWWILSDFLRDIFEWLYQQFSGFYDQITAHHLRGLTAPTAKADPPQQAGR